jgi:hypothetical protein
MAEVTERHRTLAHEVYMIGELHGRSELYKAIAQAIADAEERGPRTEEKNDDEVRTS